MNNSTIRKYHACSSLLSKHSEIQKRARALGLALNSTQVQTNVANTSMYTFYIKSCVVWCQFFVLFWWKWWESETLWPSIYIILGLTHNTEWMMFSFVLEYVVIKYSLMSFKFTFCWYKFFCLDTSFYFNSSSFLCILYLSIVKMV